MLKKTAGNNLTIYWNPNVIIETTTGVMMSPTTVLNHELDHALGLDKASKDNKKLQEHIANRKKGSDSQYITKEERRVIMGSEQITAKALGEIKDGEVTREDHFHRNIFEAESPTSNKPKATVLSEIEVVGNKKEYEK